MSRWLYAGLLAACLLATLPLGRGVRGRWRRLSLTVLPVLVPFAVWDSYAVSRGQWSFSRALTLGLRVGDLPIEELAFFVVVPVCAVLTFEAVGAVRRRR